MNAARDLFDRSTDPELFAACPSCGRALDWSRVGIHMGGDSAVEPWSRYDAVCACGYEYTWKDERGRVR